ncbi:MAG: hypothetical protein H0X39_01605 [Actinobacteria bacterium]|nr:hypothetical protein [Actinomycetota bacterium]
MAQPEIDDAGPANALTVRLGAVLGVFEGVLYASVGALLVIVGTTSKLVREVPPATERSTSPSSCSTAYCSR